MKLLFQILSLILFTSCSSVIGNKHLDEKTFSSIGITVKWYRISEITTIHDFIDIERWGQTKTIMKANTGGIYDVLLKGDTVTIQMMKDLIVYDLTAKTSNCYIKVDTSITICQYMEKHVPQNAKHHCNEAISESSRTGDASPVKHR